MAVPSPEHSKKWLGLLMPLLREGSAVLSLFLLIASVVIVWFLLSALHRCQGITIDLVNRLLAAKDAHSDLARDCPRHPP